ncbi:MAG: hypothetical protein JXA21_21670 [Anaerolineae bacterium]|nr:hypothetical protein [Anaerolineae bacterium]
MLPTIDSIVLLFVVPILLAITEVVIVVLFGGGQVLWCVGAIFGLCIGGSVGWIAIHNTDTPSITWSHVKSHLPYLISHSLAWAMIGMAIFDSRGWRNGAILGVGIGLTYRLLSFSTPTSAFSLTWKTLIWIFGGILLGFCLRLPIVLMAWKTDMAEPDLIWGLVRWSMAGAGMGWLNAVVAKHRSCQSKTG